MMPDAHLNRNSRSFEEAYWSAQHRAQLIRGLAVARVDSGVFADHDVWAAVEAFMAETLAAIDAMNGAFVNLADGRHA